MSFENGSFFPKTSLQWENHPLEYHFLELSVSMPAMPCVHLVPHTMPSTKNNKKIIRESSRTKTTSLNTTEFKKVKSSFLSSLLRLISNTSNLEISSNIYSNPISEYVLETKNDLDVLITLQKVTRSCTLHPISKYVSYYILSPSFRAFTINLSLIANQKYV